MPFSQLSTKQELEEAKVKQEAEDLKRKQDLDAWVARLEQDEREQRDNEAFEQAAARATEREEQRLQQEQEAAQRSTASQEALRALLGGPVRNPAAPKRPASDAPPQPDSSAAWIWNPAEETPGQPQQRSNAHQSPSPCSVCRSPVGSGNIWHQLPEEH